MHVNSSDKNLAIFTALPKIFHQFSNTEVAQCARKKSLSAFLQKKIYSTTKNILDRQKSRKTFAEVNKRSVEKLFFLYHNFVLIYFTEN